MLYPELSRLVVDAFHDVHRELRSGLLEANYRNAMAVALTEAGVQVDAELPVAVYFRDHVVGHYRLDLVVERTIVLECKAAQGIRSEHRAQLLNYLHATRMRLGYELNFGPVATFKRLIYDERNPLNSL